MDTVPVTVLTGFLGAGKTTLLNRILTEPHGGRYAVIVNEFGEIGIDNDLIVDTDEEIFEMNNGCVCCTVRGDLIRIISGLMRRRDRFDAILVETTGLADPAPVAQTFFVDEDVRARARLDAVVTVVDAAHVLNQLDANPEVEEQIGFADVVLLNKIDAVPEGDLDRIEARVRRMNPHAAIVRTQRCDVPLDRILDRGAFDLARVLENDPGFLERAPRGGSHDHHGHDHDHDHDHDHHDHDSDRAFDHGAVASVSLVADRPIDPERFRRWFQGVLDAHGPDILRSKGILDFRGEARRYVLHAVHMMVEADFQRPWREGEARSSRLVFIGRNLDPAALRAGFEACAA